MENNYDYSSFKKKKRKKQRRRNIAGLIAVFLIFGASVAFICFKSQIMNFCGVSVSDWMQMDKAAAAEATAVTKEDLHLRSKAGTSADILRTLPEGTTVTVLDCSNEAWTKIETADGMTGWCSSQYLGLSKSALSAGDSSTQVQASSNSADEPQAQEANGEPEISNVSLTDAARPLSVSVSLANQQVTVLDAENRTVEAFACSSGKQGSETPTGKFTVSDRGKSFFNKNIQEGAYYWVRFYNSYLFHSVPFDSSRTIEQDEADKLGSPASHGCLRLSVENAKWIYDNIPNGTEVSIENG